MSYITDTSGKPRGKLRSTAAWTPAHHGFQKAEPLHQNKPAQVWYLEFALQHPKAGTVFLN